VNDWHKYCFTLPYLCHESQTSSKAAQSIAQAAASSAHPAQQERATALQQLRCHEKQQLDKLKQLRQRRLAQKLEEERQQAEAIYSSVNTTATAAHPAAQTTAMQQQQQQQQQASRKQSPSMRTRSLSPAVAPAQVGRAAAAAVAAPAVPSKALGRSGIKLQQLLNPAESLPSFSSTAGKGATRAKGSKKAPPTAAGTAEALPTSVQASAVAVQQQVVAAVAPASESAGDNAVQEMAGSLPPAAEGNSHQQCKHSLRTAAQGAAGSSPAQASGKKAAAAAAIAGDYDKPWRKNMKAKPAASQQPAATAAASGAGEAAAAPAWARLLAAAAGAAQPVVLKSKKRTPEEQAQLQVRGIEGLGCSACGRRLAAEGLHSTCSLWQCPTFAVHFAAQLQVCAHSQLLLLLHFCD
jgi:hypothetical protein